MLPKQRYCIPERDTARFVAHKEDVLDVYTDYHSEEEPLICMAEAALELKGDKVEPIPLTPGNERKEDYHYERNGSRAIFLIC